MHGCKCPPFLFLRNLTKLLSRCITEVKTLIDDILLLNGILVPYSNSIILIHYNFTPLFIASCLNCFDKMDEIVESCRLFIIKKTKCDFNTKAQECEGTKTSLTKYRSNKECQGRIETLFIE